MKYSPVTEVQMIKVVKAILYSFAAGFVTSLSLLSVNFLDVVQSQTVTVNEAFYALMIGAFTGGINGVMVYVKQLFTEEK
jgi:hypothetical protein